MAIYSCELGYLGIQILHELDHGCHVMPITAFDIIT